MEKSEKGFIIPLILVILIVLVVGGTTYIYYSKHKIEKPSYGYTQKTNIVKTSIVPEPTKNLNGRTIHATVPTGNWKSYNNNSLGFSLKYPENFDQPNENFPSLSTIDFSKEGSNVLQAKLGVYYSPEFHRNMTVEELIAHTWRVVPTVVRENIIVDNKPGVKLTIYASGNIEVILKEFFLETDTQNHKILTITTSDEKTLDSNTFDSIIATLKFM